MPFINRKLLGRREAEVTELRERALALAQAEAADRAERLRTCEAQASSRSDAALSLQHAFSARPCNCMLSHDALPPWLICHNTCRLELMEQNPCALPSVLLQRPCLALLCRVWPRLSAAIHQSRIARFRSLLGHWNA